MRIPPPVYSRHRRLLLIETQSLLQENNDFVFQAATILLSLSDEGRMKRQRQPQAQILDRLFYLGFAHAGSVAKSESLSQVRSGPLTISIEIY